MYNDYRVVGVIMGKIDNYQKIYEIVESDLLQNILKRGRRFDEEGNQVFWYVDIDDFQEYDFDLDEEKFLVDCLEQKEIVVYDRNGNEYIKHSKSVEKANYGYLYENKEEILDKLRLYHENGDINLRNELVMDNMHIVERVARKIVDEYQVSYYELVQMGSEYLIHIIEEYDIKMINNFFHYVYMWMMKYLLRKTISTYDFGNSNIKIIRRYMDAKKNVESIYGVTLEDNPKLLDEIIDLMVEEYGNDKKMFEHSEMIVDYNKNIKDSEYNQLMENNYRATDKGYEYRQEINANLEPIGVDELLEQMDIIKNDNYNLFDRDRVVNKLYEAISQLTERDQEIINMRYGLIDGKCYSLEEIGKKRGRTKQAIDLRKKKIIEKLKMMLKEMLDENTLKEYFTYEDEYLEEKKNIRR